MVQDGKDYLVHVLPQPEVDLLLLLQGFHELERIGEAGQRPGPGSGAEGAQTPSCELVPDNQGAQETIGKAGPRTNLSTRLPETSQSSDSSHLRSVSRAHTWASPPGMWIQLVCGGTHAGAITWYRL